MTDQSSDGSKFGKKVAAPLRWPAVLLFFAALSAVPFVLAFGWRLARSTAQMLGS